MESDKSTFGVYFQLFSPTCEKITENVENN